MTTPRTGDTAGYELSAPFLFARGGTRLIQIQPTLRCNLRCRHCYSESGPERRSEIPLARFESFLSQARGLGYGYVGVSGGEPLLWSDLERFLDFARHEGFVTSITTNGTLLKRDRAIRLRGRVGLVAVSVDGPPAEHAEIRASKTAFRSMQRGLAALREADVPFALVFTLTRYNAHHLRWLYEFAVREGALGIQVHPLCDFGFASVNLEGAAPDSVEFKAAAWLLALLVEQHGPGGPAVTLDAIPRAQVEQACWPMLTSDGASLGAEPFADLVPSLIVEPDGCVAPFIYGFPRRWALGNLDGEPLAKAAERWCATSGASVAALVQSTLQHLAAADAEYIDLFAAVLASARQEEAPMPRTEPS